MNKDLTVGKPETVLWKFCLPLFGSVLFQQLYNIADSLIAGKFISENALAAVGNSYEITLIFIAIAFGINIGTSVIVSRYFGAKRLKKMKTVIYTAFLFCAIICIVLTVLVIIFCDDLLRLINTPAEVFADSKLYLDIYVLGVIFVFFYNVTTGIFSAMGDSKTPFIFLACSSTANILMDIWFVVSFKMEVAGVAWATFICQAVACILSMTVVLKRIRKIQDEENTKEDTKSFSNIFSFASLKEIIYIAIPSMLQQSFISVGNVIIQGLINSFGTGVMAGYSSAIKMNNLVISSIMTIANGISNFTSQNLGAEKFDRVHEGFKSGLKIVYTIVTPIFILYFFCGEVFIKFFLENPTEEALNTGILILKILSIFYYVVGLKLVADAILRGSSKMNLFMAATFIDLLLRVVFAIILSQTELKSLGIWLSWPIGWAIAAALSVIFYKKIEFKKELL